MREIDLEIRMIIRSVIVPYSAFQKQDFFT